MGEGRAALTTVHPAPGRAEQDPEDWWASVVLACRQLPGPLLAAVRVVAFAAARETFVPVDGDGHAIGRGILWSDRRAESAVAKLAWLERREPNRLAAAQWIMAPRDFVVLRLTGQAVTDRTLAGRAGFVAGTPRIPRILESTDVAGKLGAAAGELGLPPGAPVVIGAGDRPSEVLGSGATAREPMVSWGTTANLSVPGEDAPAGAVLSPGALGGSIVEFGLSAAGEAVEWFGRIAGRSTAELIDAASESPPGAGGVVAVPWFNGARAPWWQAGAHAAFLHLSLRHTAGDLARALFEGVAWEIGRCLDALGGADRLVAAGGGAFASFWPELLAGVTGLPVCRRRSPELASVGACLIAAAAIGLSFDPEVMNPVATVVEPDADLVERYRRLRPGSDEAAEAVVRLGGLTP